MSTVTLCKQLTTIPCGRRAPAVRTAPACLGSPTQTRVDCLFGQSDSNSTHLEVQRERAVRNGTTLAERPVGIANVPGIQQRSVAASATGDDAVASAAAAFLKVFFKLFVRAGNETHRLSFQS